MTTSVCAASTVNPNDDIELHCDLDLDLDYGPPPRKKRARSESASASELASSSTSASSSSQSRSSKATSAACHSCPSVVMSVPVPTSACSVGVAVPVGGEAASPAAADHPDLSISASASPAPAHTTRDQEYYFDDGSAVILVEDVLFKVHKSVLSRDSSTFETLFRLPQRSGEHNTEGVHDTKPVVLPGDSPEQFRSLLWALYTLPHEIIEAGSPTMQGDWPYFDKFYDLTLVAHKYCFKSLETWALKTFLRWLAPTSRQPLPRIHSSTALSIRTTSPPEPSLLDRLRRVLELAVLCEDKFLHDAVVQHLLDELRAPDADLPWFIALGERFAIELLAGAAYYALMIQGRDKWLALAAATPHPKLSPAQLAKLHNGYYALVTLWERLRATPPNIPPCMHYGHSCRQRWQAYWKELTKDDLIMSRFPADVLGKLETMLSQLYAYTGIMDMHQECRSKGVAAVRVLHNETKDGLAKNFVELP